jgi:xanthine dehydrogenase iron-sulfur cluster and FAD-binding subunit A
MNKIISSTLALVALGVSANSVIASDYADEVEDIRLSVSALERQLEVMDVDYNLIEIKAGLNRSQEVKALESKYSSLQEIFNNVHNAN